MRIVKLILIGFITTVLRSVLQLIIPPGQQTVLAPSAFVKSGTLPLVFMIYGTFAYTMVAVIFLFLQKNMSGNRVIKGLGFGLSCSLLWSIYLQEPLPHAAILDKITYPLADSAALLIMGVLLGRFIAVSSPIRKYVFTKYSLFNVGLITSLFFIGRMIEYKFFNIYSSFGNHPMASMLWVIGAGVVIGVIFDYINLSIGNRSIVTRSFMFGVVFFGVNLFAFNFFMPIVFKADLLDLFIRTIMDIVFVLMGSFLVNQSKNKETFIQ